MKNFKDYFSQDKMRLRTLFAILILGILPITFTPLHEWVIWGGMMLVILLVLVGITYYDYNKDLKLQNEVINSHLKNLEEKLEVVRRSVTKTEQTKVINPPSNPPKPKDRKK